jgi:hypothetical protein
MIFSGDGAGGATVYLFHDNYVISFTKGEGALSINDFNTILSTFKFTDSATANWKTYNSTQYSFAFQYPSDWNINESVQKGTVFGDLPTVSVIDKSDKISIEESNYNPTWRATIVKDSFNGSISAYMSKYDKAVQGLPVKTTKDINNQTTYVIDGTTPPVPQNFYVVFMNGYVYQLTGPKEFDAGTNNKNLEKIVTQILSTFKFTDTKVSSDQIFQEVSTQFGFTKNQVDILEYSDQTACNIAINKSGTTFAYKYNGKWQIAGPKNIQSSL